MFKKITASAISTVLCLNAVIPCISDCSEKTTAENSAKIRKSAVVTNNYADADEEPENTEETTPETSESTDAAEDSSNEPAPEIDIPVEPTEQEPVEEGSLGATISYRLYDDGTLFISGRGIMNNYSKSPFNSPELINRAVISNNEGTIFSVGSYVFSNCENMTEIYIPGTVITIEKNAFSNCTALSLVQFDGAEPANAGELVLSGSIEDVKEAAFSNCKSFDSVIVPETTMALGKSVFSGCTFLKKVVIKGEKTTIGEYIFDSCASLEDLTFPFAGYALESVNESDSSAWLGYMFGSSVSDDNGTYTYAVRSPNGYTRHIPNSLESITVLGGKNIPSYAFDGFSSLKKVVIPDDIDVIGNASFRNCSSLTEFEMPSALTAIGDSAFEGCASVSVDIPENVTKIGRKAFTGCTSITEINVPETAEMIGESAFSGCTFLKKVVIKSEKTTIGEYIFDSCASLAELTLPFAGYALESVNESGSSAWLGFMFGSSVSDDNGTYTYAVRSSTGYTRHIPNSLESITVLGGKNIPTYAFDGFSSLKKVVIPDDIDVIGNASFRNCSSLTEFEMPSALTAIGDSAFEGCASVSVDIPENVTKIGRKAFADCTSITEINVPETAEMIGESAFSGCTFLKKVVIKSEKTTIGEYIFDSCASLAELTLPFAGYALESVNESGSSAWLGFMFGSSVSDDNGVYTYAVRSSNGYTRHIPNSLESITVLGGKNIPTYAFDGFSSLKKVVIPDDIDIIGNASFRNCSSLTDFELPSKVTSIGDSAFESCSAISVDIPKGVTKIGNKAFADCTSITEITVPKATETIGDSAFSGCTSLKKAVIKGGSTKIGDCVFNRCISLEDLTLPFAAYNEESANTENSGAWMGFMFGDSVSDENGEYTYGVNYNGYIRHIPSSLKNITFIGGEYVSNRFMQGFAGVENVTIPETVKGIGTGAFDGCDGITNVFYQETEESWEDVDVKDKNESIDGKVTFLPDPVLGDTNNDGVIDASDASNILAVYAESSTGSDAPTKYTYKICDVNRDGIIDSADASTVLEYYAYASTRDEAMSFEEFINSK